MAEITEDQIRDGTPIDESEMRTDMGPSARRAQAGLPPQPDTQDPNPGGMQHPGRVRFGAAQMSPATAFDPSLLGPEGQQKSFETGVEFRPQTELEGDPMARDVISFTALGPMGRLLSATRAGRAAATVAESKGASALKADANAWRGIKGPHAERMVAQAEAEAAELAAAEQAMRLRSPFSPRGFAHDVAALGARAAPAMTGPLSTPGVAGMFAGIPRRYMVNE